ncbi:hypothetical protein DV515_00013629 [Chloebia gouldiae]|uniref:Uncharacterized protein n=1 Tax=Chloebia gouldiae TaxID=44316 RepID=A0A3L8S1E8_CHLGU|nr:hypothetical protein DV515_00013629 [Chloebia gouldiae]
MAACVSRMELSVACQSLLHGDLSSGSDPLCVLLRDAGDGRWAEIAQKSSRTAKTLNSAGCERKKLVVDYYFEKVRKLKSFSVHLTAGIEAGKASRKGHYYSRCSVQIMTVMADMT